MNGPFFDAPRRLWIVSLWDVCGKGSMVRNK